MSDLTKRLHSVEEYLLSNTDGDICAPEALYAECCYRARHRIEELEHFVYTIIKHDDYHEHIDDAAKDAYELMKEIK